MKHQYLVDKDNQIRVTIVFDKLGRQQSITNGVATSVFAYDPATLALDTETINYNLPGQPASLGSVRAFKHPDLLELVF